MKREMDRSDTSDRKSNRLSSEKSPYLKQHAENPVDWYPWGEEAFAEARRRDVPIFLSIGYATCHWCHVMERETFEDEQTAALMNRLFVNIKVDREERPDVDATYMGAAQALTGQGGWPLSVWLTPSELLPFYAGTYFPPIGRYGRPGFRELLAALSEAWEHDRTRVENSAGQITDAIRRGTSVSPPDLKDITLGSSFETWLDPLISDAVERLAESFDPEYGGFGPAPKFPRPSVLFFLLDAAASGGEYAVANEGLFDMVERTLRGVAQGGIHDHLGGGFARYSVDRYWRVPHFEKMLYDQGQLLEAMSRLYTHRPLPLLADRIRTTIAYLKRDMAAADGLFHAAEDADSEGAEGTFYVWTESEVDSILDKGEASLLKSRYGITAEGNFEKGKNVLHTELSLDELSARYDVDRREIERRLADAEKKLLEVRSGRPRPLLDNKVITSWNGLLLSGLAWSSRALDDDEIYEIATDLANGLMESMWEGEDLMRRKIDGELRHRGFLEDYAHLLKGLIDLYDARQEVIWLENAERVARRAISLFADPDGGGFFMSDNREDDLPVRTRSDHDGAEPSGNSVMVWGLARLGQLLDIQEFRTRALETAVAYADRVRQYPDVMPMMFSGALHLTTPPASIVVVEAEDDPEGFRQLVEQGRALREVNEDLIVIGSDGPDSFLLDRLEWLSETKPLDGRSVAYRCRNFACGMPVTNLSEENSSI